MIGGNEVSRSDRRQQIDLLRPVAEVVNLIHVQQTAFSARLHRNEVPPTVPGPVRMSTNISVTPRVQGTDLLIIDADYSLAMNTESSAHGAETDSEQAFASLETHFVLVYSCPRAGTFHEDQLRAFATINGAHNLWPYLREYVQSALMRLGVPGVTVPTLQRMPVQMSGGQQVGSMESSKSDQ